MRRMPRPPIGAITKIVGEVRKLSRVVEQTADSVLITNRAGVIEYVNPAFEKMTGFAKEEVLGKTPRILKSGQQDQLFYKELWNTILSGRVFRSVLLNKKKSGDLYYWEQTITPITDAQGRITHFVSTAKDVTQRMHAEKIKEEFLRTVSHELRTPIAVVRESVSQITEGLYQRDPQGEQETLSLALKTIDRLAQLINDLLDISKVEAGKMPLKRERMDLIGAAKEVSASFAHRAQQKGLELMENFPKAPLEIWSDRDKLIQIWSNLVSNALKFTPTGTITLSVVDKTDAVECAVSDTGCGISEKDLPYVFLKFKQFGTSTDPREKGTGLGLAICKALVELHRGNIRVESRVNQGTKFLFTIPKPTPLELFRERVADCFKEPLQRGEPCSILILRIQGFRKLKEKFLESKGIEEFLRTLLRDRTDVAGVDLPTLLMGLPGTGKTQALAVGRRVVQRAAEYFSHENFGCGSPVNVSWRVISLPK